MQRKIWHKSYDPGVPPELDFEDIVLPGFLQRSAERHPRRTALVFENLRMSYRELLAEVERMAGFLASLGVGRGDRVALHLPNLPQTVIATFGILRANAQVVMTNPLYTPREIEHQWNDAGCRVAITADFLFEGRLRAIRDQLPVEHYVVTSIPDYLRFPLNLLAPLKLKRMDPPSWARVRPGAGIHFLRPSLREAPAPPPLEVGMEDGAMLQYTGGTTGVSKGAQLLHRNLSRNTQQVASWFPDCEEGREVLLACLPYFHIFGLTISMMWPVSTASSIVLMPNPRDIPKMIQNIEKHRVTLFPAVPALFNAINNFQGVRNRDLSSVKACFSGSAPLPVEVLEQFERLTGSKIVEGYGLTETSPVLTVNPLHGTRKIGSVGIPVPSTDVKIVDPEDGVTEKPVGQEGELIAQGPQVMAGYWNRPEETAEVLRDGWLYTGDLATMDEDGYFRIVGRKKDMIIAGGYNIYPDEIDDVLMSHPAVLEACTIGVPDERRGETVVSYVVPAEGQEVSEEELDTWCRERLAAYKVPRRFVFREELPKSAMMKLLRRVLREEALAESRDGARAG